MYRNYLKLLAIAVATMLIAPVAIHAQDEKPKEKEKVKTDKKDVEQIIITRKGDNKEKVTVEINGDKITVNGKPIEDLKDGDITVNRHKGNSVYTYTPGRNWNWNDDDGALFGGSDNRAMLGVVTDKVEQGAKITDITEESGAAKAGLKEDDIITKVDETKIEDPDDLTKAIRSRKPGDKVSITYLRDKKEQKATAELSKWKGAGFNAMNMKMPNMNFDVMPKALPKTRVTPGQYYGFLDNRPRLGLSVQDTDDGKGVKVIDVDDEGNALKAGVKKDDVITAINDKEVNNADEVAKIVRENKEKGSIMLKIKRDGKTQNIEVKMPRKLKTADL
ncbi:MAG TPA: PDZ domain-containing protein [Chitinophagaceae bacterium]|jgi:serine protease Do|nr:PDZ domain-containing protein [Chitinophagaceae bacterium]